MRSPQRQLALDVIAAFGGLTRTARALGHKNVTTVQGWKRAGRIPHWRQAEILAAAGRESVTLPASFGAKPAGQGET
jgi:hypothetical protein